MATTWRSNVTLARETAGLISERIFSGWYDPGEQLPQTLLAQELGVSRTPLREALNLLEKDGLIQIDGLGRAKVTQMANHLLKDALIFRRMLEIGACGLLQDNKMATQQHEVLSGEPGAWSPQSRSAFHTGLLERCGNEYLRLFVPIVRMTEEVVLPAFAWYEETTASSDRYIEATIDEIIQGSVQQAQRELQVYFDELLDLIESNERTTS